MRLTAAIVIDQPNANPDVYPVKNVMARDVMNTIILLEQDDVLHIRGLGTLVVDDFEVSTCFINSEEVRSVFIFCSKLAM